jgi:hypothetical protein
VGQSSCTIQPEKESQPVSGEIAEMKTKAGEVIIILPEGKSSNEWSVFKESPRKMIKSNTILRGKPNLESPECINQKKKTN